MCARSQKGPAGSGSVKLAAKTSGMAEQYAILKTNACERNIL